MHDCKGLVKYLNINPKILSFREAHHVQAH